MPAGLEALERLSRLRESGALTEDEFQSEKRRLLAGVPYETDDRTTPELGRSNVGVLRVIAAIGIVAVVAVAIVLLSPPNSSERTDAAITPPLMASTANGPAAEHQRREGIATTGPPAGRTPAALRQEAVSSNGEATIPFDRAGWLRNCIVQMTPVARGQQVRRACLAQLRILEELAAAGGNEDGGNAGYSWGDYVGRISYQCLELAGVADPNNSTTVPQALEEQCQGIAERIAI